MIDNIVKSILCTGVLAASGCFSTYNSNKNKAAYPKPVAIQNNKAQKPDIIQKASFYVFVDKYNDIDKITPNNLTWNFEYRVTF